MQAQCLAYHQEQKKSSKKVYWTNGTANACQVIERRKKGREVERVEGWMATALPNCVHALWIPLWPGQKPDIKCSG